MINLDIAQIITQILAFLLMLWILKKFGWKPLLNLLKERQQTIQSKFDAIASGEEDVKKLAEEYHEKLRTIDTEARHKIQEAITEGRKIAVGIQEEAQANVKAMLAKAKAEADREVAQAKKQLKNDLVNMSLAITEKILRQTLDESTQKKLIADFVKEAKLE